MDVQATPSEGASRQSKTPKPDDTADGQVDFTKDTRVPMDDIDGLHCLMNPPDDVAVAEMLNVDDEMEMNNDIMAIKTQQEEVQDGSQDFSCYVSVRRSGQQSDMDIERTPRSEKTTAEALGKRGSSQGVRIGDGDGHAPATKVVKTDHNPASTDPTQEDEDGPEAWGEMDIEAELLSGTACPLEHPMRDIGDGRG